MVSSDARYNTCCTLHQSCVEKLGDFIRTHRTLPIEQLGKHSAPSSLGSTTYSWSGRRAPREATESEPQERGHQRLAPGPVEWTELVLVVFTFVPRMDEVERGSCKGSLTRSLVWSHGEDARTLASSLGLHIPTGNIP